MKRSFVFLLALLVPALTGFSQQEKPLRVFLRTGVKTHGPGQHDHPRFLADWKELLNQRGAQADGALDFPTADQLEKTDVLVLFAAEAATIKTEQRLYLDTFLKRGGGLVVLHDAVCGTDPQWFKTIVGGAWEHGHSKWYEGEVGVYFVDADHPITRGVSNFDFKDEIYHDLHMMPEAKILATSFHSVFVIAPQMWVYEKTMAQAPEPYRAFVWLQGHEYASFSLPHVRALLLRGIAWAGKRANVDAFCQPEELASLKYPEGGPTAPEKAAAKLFVHPDFDISLVAAEPLVEKVISLDWDRQGRLWVAETPEYPGGRTIHKSDLPSKPYRTRDPEKFSGKEEDRPGKDRISWLEDSDGDGRMDKKHIFCEGLELVTSLVFHRDGVIVAQAPDILWIRDTDGDGKADKVEKLYTGFGTFDTHAVINNFRWGMDGWVYGAVGYSAGTPTSGDGATKFGRLTAGIFRFRPDGSAIEQYASGSCNTWGFDFAPDGEAFYTTATCGEHFLHIVMPEKTLARGSVGGVRVSAVIPDHQNVFPAVHHTRPAYVQIDWVGKFTAAAGSCFYDGGAWPDRFNAAHFLSEPTVSLVHLDLLKPKGSTYVASKEPGREETEFIAGADLWFRPVHSRVGPDGALYVVDFYNQAAIHNDTRGPAHGARNAATRPDRDHHFARVWRIQHKSAKPLPAWNLAGGDAAGLVKMIEHPNGWVRGTAARLLRESGNGASAPLLADLVKSSASPYGRINALWALHNLDQLEEPLLIAAINDADPILRKNALRVVAEKESAGDVQKRRAVEARLNDPDPRAKLQALIALGSFEPSIEIAQAVVSAWPALSDKYLQSAALGVASGNPRQCIEIALSSDQPAAMTELVSKLATQIAQKQDIGAAGQLVVTSADRPPAADLLKVAIYEALAKDLKPDLIPPWRPELEKAFGRLLASANPDVPAAALPLVARWDQEGRLASNLQPVITLLSAKLQDPNLPDAQRGQVAVNLLGVRQLSPDIVPAVAKILGSPASDALQKRVVEALGAAPNSASGAALIAAFPRLGSELREAIFAQLIKRSEWSLALVKALEDRHVDALALGPPSLFRLRTHSDKTVAARANEVIDALRGPEQKEKDKLIAQFRPIVETPGNVLNGKALFTQNCAVCHKFNGEGKDLAPDLTGMGVHGAAELLVHIVDPNRLVEPNFIAVNIETKDEQSYTGIIARENRTSVVLRDANNEVEIRLENIKSRNSTGRSLMPEGFEALSGEGLRDLLTYVCAGEKKYRSLDLRPIFTANSLRGIYNSPEVVEETLKFKRFGLVKAGDVPFEIVSPAKTIGGNNLIVLKGGQGFAKTLPQKVTLESVGLRASRLHFLGGVGGWAWPCCGDDKNEKMPVAKVTVKYADGGSEEILLRNGVEFVDYIDASYEAPSSKQVPGLVSRGQVRSFTKPLQRAGVIQTISLESFDNIVAPTFVAITAETGEAGDAGSPQGSSETSQVATPAFRWSNGIHTLIVGGGSSHDFGKWFQQADSATLSENGKNSVNYTDEPSAVLATLKELDVLYLSNNQPLADDPLRKAIFRFADSGKGLLLVHPALWYNWKDWPEYNRTLVGGGARSHDRYGEFEVTVDDPSHPVTAGVPRAFRIADELYHFERDDQGTPMQILATGKNLTTGKSYPVAWITKHPKARIVCITLGHDDKAHQHPAYQTLLQNSLRWTAGK